MEKSAMQKAMESVGAQQTYWLGVRDRYLNHACTHPPRPFTSKELQAYQRGYNYPEDMKRIWPDA